MPTAHTDLALLQGTGVVKTDRVTINENFESAWSWSYSDNATEPALTYPGQPWNDASALLLKQRFHGNTDWHAAGALAPLDDSEAPHLGVLGVYVTKDAEGTAGADLITFTCQVTDVRASAAALPVAGRKVLRVRIATSSFGAPGGTQTVTVTTGVLLKAHTTDQYFDLETDADGTAAFTVSVTGAGTRHVRASVGDSDATELSGTWA